MDNKGEGIKINTILPNTRIEQVISAKEEKPISNWQKRFLGVPVWGWIIISGCLVYGGLLLGIALTTH